MTPWSQSRKRFRRFLPINILCRCEEINLLDFSLHGTSRRHLEAGVLFSHFISLIVSLTLRFTLTSGWEPLIWYIMRTGVKIKMTVLSLLALLKSSITWKQFCLKKEKENRKCFETPHVAREVEMGKILWIYLFRNKQNSSSLFVKPSVSLLTVMWRRVNQKDVLLRPALLPALLQSSTRGRSELSLYHQSH